MTRRRAPRLLGGGLVVAGALGAACVDLFHATDFETLCTVDAAACTTEASSPIDAGPGKDPGVDPEIDFCASSRVEARARAERACAWLGACKGAPEQLGLGACMVHALAVYDCRLNPSLRPQGAARALWACLAGVGSCEAVDRCLFGGPAPPCAPVAEGSFTACSPDRPPSTVVECAPQGIASVVPCTFEGRSCVAVDPSTATCAGTKGLACSGAPRCDGTHAVVCDTTTDIGLDCASLGAGRCVDDGDGGVACAPSEDAGACDGGTSVVCDDAGARSCVGGREVRIDCAALGNPCSADAATPLHAISACSYIEADRCTKDECVGDVLRACVQGRTHDLDCAAVDLGPCATPPAGRAPTCTRR